MDEIVPIRIEFGEDKSWDQLCGLPSEEITRNTAMSFDDELKLYRVQSFGMEFMVNPCDRAIFCDDPRGKVLMLGKLKDFFRLAVLWYMSSAKDIPYTGRLVRPQDLKGGHRFVTGTHVLPADRIAERFATDKDGFIAHARRYGAEVINDGYGDAAVRLYPLPRVPVTMILWLADEEYPPRVDILFDSTCDLQLSLSDIVWAVAMMAALVMLED